MIENIKSTTIFITVGKMYVSHVTYSMLSEEVTKLDMDKIYGKLSNTDIDKCYKFDNIQEAHEVCNYLIDMGLQPVIKKRSVVIRDEEIPVKKGNKNDDLVGGNPHVAI